MRLTVKALRVNNNLTQRQAALKVGVTEDTWAKWENARTFPDVLKIRRIEDEFGVSNNGIFFCSE